MADINLLQGSQTQTESNAERVDTKLIPPHSIKQMHLESGVFAIKVGLSTDRPDDSQETKFWFSTDTKKLAYWTGTAWIESAVFS